MIPENPTAVYLLGGAVTALAGVVAYLYTQSQKQRKDYDNARDKHEERLLNNQQELRELLEKTLIAFQEVDKTLLKVEQESMKEIIKAIIDSRKEVVEDIKEYMRGMR